LFYFVLRSCFTACPQYLNLCRVLRARSPPPAGAGENVKFQSYSKFPPCYKDITFWVPDQFHENAFFELVGQVRFWSFSPAWEPISSLITRHACPQKRLRGIWWSVWRWWTSSHTQRPTAPPSASASPTDRWTGACAPLLLLLSFTSVEYTSSDTLNIHIHARTIWPSLCAGRSLTRRSTNFKRRCAMKCPSSWAWSYAEMPVPFARSHSFLKERTKPHV
jgi:hypothetical protein